MDFSDKGCNYLISESILLYAKQVSISSLIHELLHRNETVQQGDQTVVNRLLQV